MRVTTLLSAAFLLLVSSALAAPAVKRQGVDAELDAEQQPAPAAPCTDSRRRSWVPFWRRQIVAATDCSFMLHGGGGTDRGTAGFWGK